MGAVYAYFFGEGGDGEGAEGGVGGGEDVADGFVREAGVIHEGAPGRLPPFGWRNVIQIIFRSFVQSSTAWG